MIDSDLVVLDMGCNFHFPAELFKSLITTCLVILICNARGGRGLLERFDQNLICFLGKFIEPHMVALEMFFPA